MSLGIQRNQYLKGMLVQVLDAYKTLRQIQDVPGNLENVNREMLKINGLLKVMAVKIDEYYGSGDAIVAASQNLKRLGAKFRHYLDGYYFEKEIQTMSELYADDVNRLKNMRLKILEALEDRKMITEIEDIVEEM